MDPDKLEQLKKATGQLDDQEEDKKDEDEESTDVTSEEDEEEKSEEQDDKDAASEEDESEDEEEEQPPVSRRESKRIAQLLERLKDKEEEPVRSEEKKTKKQIIDEGDYDLEQINLIAQEYADERFNEGLSASKAQASAILFSTRLELDVPKVTAKYSFLDKDSDDFDAGRAGFIDKLFLKTVGYDPATGATKNPDIRYNEFVEGVMELVNTETSIKSAETATNVAKQKAKTGVRPDGASKKAYAGDSPTKMSDDQLRDAISSALSTVRR